MARCDQKTPGYEAATYRDVTTPLESVMDSNITTSLHVACPVEGQTTGPVSILVDTTQLHIYS